MPTIAAGRFVVNSDQKSASVNLGINGIAPNQAADKLVNRPESTTSVSLSTFHITNDTSINQTGFQWDEIVSIEYVGEEQVWDLSIEGTHNFLANGIVAHNTYILGNLGVGSSSPGAKLQVTGGGATVGYQEGVAAPSNGLAVFGNVGIGTTSPVAALDVRGILYANNGTAGAPAYSFSSDPDTGLFSQGANLLSLATAGTQRLTINSSGNVGIGTTNPGTSLDVRGNVTILAGSDIRPTSDSTTAINIANAAGTDMVTFDTTNTEVRMGTSLGSNENALLTLTPASATETTETLVFFSNSANFTLTIDTALTNQRFNQFTAPTIAAGAATDVTNAATVYISNAPIASVVTITNNYALWVDAGLSRFDGNVGIGSTAAGSTLQVNGNGVIGFGTTAVAGPSRGLAVSGNVGIGTTSPAQPLDVVGLINTSFGTSQSSVAVCHSGVAGASTNNDVNLIDCTGTPGADYMEMYSVEQNVEPGDIVVPGANSITTTTGSQLAKLTKSTSPYQQNLIGIVSNPQDAGDFNSIGYNIKEEDNPKPIALNGRVATKVSTENGPIAVGDFLTSSSTRGVAMKATRPGQVVGKALEEFPGTQGDPLQGKILVFVNVTFADPNDTLANLVIDENGNITTKKSAFADNLVNLTGSSNDWTDTLEGTITNNDGFVKGMDLPGVEPGRLGVSIQSSEPARPTPEREYQVLPDLSTKTITILDEWGPTTIIIRNEGGKLVMKNAQGTPTIAFDTESGSGYFTGDLIAKTLRVENIKGIDLSALIASQSATLGVKPLKEASASGESDSEQLLSRLEQLSSKLVSEASSSSQLNLDSVTAFTNLTSVGKTFLADTNIAGKLTVGTMTFDDLEDSVNTIGTLKFQDSPLAGAIELFSGSVKLARNGDIETEGVLSAKGVKTQELTITLPQEASSSAAPTNKSIGEGTIKTGDTSVIIETENVKTSSKIFVTATKLLSQPIIVTGKIENKSFTVAIAKPEAQDITFDWWIVNTQRLTLAP